VTITTAQMRGARGLLNWSQSELSKRTGISTTSIGNIEAGNTQARESTLKLIRKAFENAGIEFIGTEGMRIKQNTIDIYEGREGFNNFFDYVYQNSLSEAAEIYACNIDETLFIKWAGDIAPDHMKRMSALKGLSFKVLVKEGDHNLDAADYVEYKWLSEELFSSVPYYIFGSKLAIILFEPEPKIIVMKYPMITDAYKKQFMAFWKLATKPDRLKESA
jgi:transcriptional regulator with XRE-family HTH domain